MPFTRSDLKLIQAQVDLWMVFDFTFFLAWLGLIFLSAASFHLRNLDIIQGMWCPLGSSSYICLSREPLTKSNSCSVDPAHIIWSTMYLNGWHVIADFFCNGHFRWKCTESYSSRSQGL
ncbi:hypothetical protein GDO78_021496 [Eleutherodactylus coqui]|uniref:Uncharacterized protein n=1 Tax=Eleutherodactylus coqui TaxID=57060 RepID=A0A8J6B3Q3_ELECQ|nr:hypothetical protein GDO78_021496 [Eleutherodactylus coqui]